MKIWKHKSRKCKNINFECTYKNGKNVKFGDIETKKQKFHQHKELISIKNIDMIKITVSNNVPFVKKNYLNILWAIKMLKKLSLYV